MNEDEPLMKCRKAKLRSKMKNFALHDELGGNLYLAKWSPALRWHELYLGLCVELGNHHSDIKGEL